MHISYRVVDKRPEYLKPLLFFKYGFGIWIGRVLFGIGYDDRERAVTVRKGVQP